MATNATRETILQAGLGLFMRHGYAATGLKSILDAAGVPKGSFYHFFPEGKEAFAAEVVDVYASMAAATRQALLLSPGGPPLTRLRRYFEHYAAHFEAIGFREGCLLGDFGAEVCDDSEPIRARIQAAFLAWEADVASVVAEAVERGEVAAIGTPTETARYLIHGWEGALLRMKAEKSSAALDAFLTLTFGAVLRPPVPKKSRRA